MAKGKKTGNHPSTSSVSRSSGKSKGDQAPVSQGRATRETVESIVIAFVLAFLFRTFQAEAFVIPTGSMAPTLMGAHKDVDCTKCGQRYRVNASREGESDAALLRVGQAPAEFRRDHRTVAGTCPICRYTMPFLDDAGAKIPEMLMGVVDQPTYPGDRILVNKYLYSFVDPARWDVIVFKYPGEAMTNYIKRLVALPGETLQILQGDLFIKPPGGDKFEIARKPADKLLALRQIVHDTAQESAQLFEAGWPLRWGPTDAAGKQTATEPVGDASEGAWSIEVQPSELTAPQRYHVVAGEEAAWLRYRHTPPDYGEWLAIRTLNTEEAKRRITDLVIAAPPQPRLIGDFIAYNTELTWDEVRKMGDLRRLGQVNDLNKLPLNWVGELLLECDFSLASDQGEVALDLVQAGRHFTCTIDVATGQARLEITDFEQEAPIVGYAKTAETSIRGAGEYSLLFANVDEQLRLWVVHEGATGRDYELVEFDSSTAYDAEKLFGVRSAFVPKTSNRDAGDLAPVGVAARDCDLTVTRLQVWRDNYYIADSYERINRMKGTAGSGFVDDFDLEQLELEAGERWENVLPQLARDPSLWPLYKHRRTAEFPLGEDQFFVMGDNSPASSDARLWASGSGPGGKPGGAYLERSLLIGKAVCVYWPHSWDRIPGTSIPFPLFPNFADMRLVR